MRMHEHEWIAAGEVRHATGHHDAVRGQVVAL